MAALVYRPRMMPISGATPSQNPNINAIFSERLQLIGSPPNASAVRKLSRLRVNPRMRRLPIMCSVGRLGAGDPRSAPAGHPAMPPAELLRQREGEQRAALTGPEHPGQEPFGPRAPPGRHRDVLAAVDA